MDLRNSPMFFLFVWALSTVIYQSLGGYWSSVLSTVEEIYHLSSFQSGFLSSSDYFMSIWFSLPLVYHGQSVHRPRFMCAIGITKAVGTLIQTFPHFFYKSTIDQFLKNSTEIGGDDLFHLCTSNRTEDVLADVPECDSTVTYPLFNAPVIWFIIGRVLTCGYNAMFPIAVVYLDDGLPKRSTVAYIGIISTVYAIGFTVGYFLAAICLSIPVIPINLQEGIDVDKLPGAWWLGYLILSIMALMTSFLYLIFPAALPPPPDETAAEEQELLPVTTTTNIKANEAPEERKYLVKDKTGLGDRELSQYSTVTATPKLEHKKNETDEKLYESITKGGQAILGYVAGQLSGAFLIRHYDFNRLECAFFYFGGLLLCSLGVTTGLFIYCPEEEIVGYNRSEKATTEVISGSSVFSECTIDCSCSDVFEPVCAGGVSYMSPCLAGCQVFTVTNSNPIFYNCSCVRDTIDDQFGTLREATAGLCHEKCSSWIIYAGIGMLTCFVMSAAGNATIVMILRSVERPERALTFTFINIVVKVLGFIPGPIVFGWIIDQACLKTSGASSCYEETGGNCLLYDKAMLRNLFFGVPATLFMSTFIPTIMIIIIIWRQDKIGNVESNR